MVRIQKAKGWESWDLGRWTGRMCCLERTREVMMGDDWVHTVFRGMEQVRTICGRPRAAPVLTSGACLLGVEVYVDRDA